MDDFLEFAADEFLGPLNDVERKNAPTRLFAHGDTELLRNGLRISVVGTRKPTSLAERRTRDLVKELVERDVTVVSGLAMGIDTIAHVATIGLGGRTIAVLGTSLADCHPPQNRALQERIGRENLVVTQFPQGTPVRRQNFPRRNRTMALLTEATIIVEAGDGSGTLHQGWEALRLGRPLFLLRSLAERKTLHWPSEMLRYGAQVLSRDNLDEAFQAIPRRALGHVPF